MSLKLFSHCWKPWLLNFQNTWIICFTSLCFLDFLFLYKSMLTKDFVKYKAVFRKPEPEGSPLPLLSLSLSVMLALICTCMHIDTKKKPDIECMVLSLPPLLTAASLSLFLEKKWTIFHGHSSPVSNEEAEGHWLIGERLWYWYMSFYVVILVSPDSFLLSCFSGALSLECICHFYFILSKHKQST